MSEPPNAAEPPEPSGDLEVLDTKESGLWSRLPRRRVVVAVGLAVVLISVGAAYALWPDDAGPAEAAAPAGTPAAVTPAAAPSPEPVDEPSVQEAVAPGKRLAGLYGDSVWRLEVAGCGYEGAGTAFMIGPRMLVTSAHLVASDPAPRIVSADGNTSVRAAVIGADHDLDVAVLGTDDDLPGQPLPWDPAAAVPDRQELVALGLVAAGGELVAGGVTAGGGEDGGTAGALLRLDRLPDKGLAGGPVLTGDGTVVGMATHLVVDGPQLIPALRAGEQVPEAIERIQQERPGLGAGCDSPPVVPGAPDGWGPPDTPDPRGYGGDLTLDRLLDGCTDGNMSACDELYWQSPYGTEYETVAITCGGTVGPAYGACSWDADWAEPQAVGDDPHLDELWDACEGGDLAACDDLYAEAPDGSAYKEFGALCGGAGEGNGRCHWDESDDPFLDELWVACEDGEMTACDELFFYAPVGSEYEEFGATCGRTREWTDGMCAL